MSSAQRFCPDRLAAVARTLAIGACLVCLCVPARASLIHLGAAGAFNALVLGDMTGRSSDVEGRLAVAGNLDLRDFGLGLQLPDSNGSRDDLIIGGDARLFDARLNHGNAVYGGRRWTDDSFGLYSDDDPATPNGTLRREKRDAFFQRLRADVEGKARAWGGLDPTGEIRVRGDDSSIWEIDFVGTGALNVFAIQADVLGSPHKAIRFDVPADSIALVNVSGTEATLSHSGFFHTAYTAGPEKTPNRLPDNGPPGGFRHDGRFTDGILFNFFEADSLLMEAIGVKGSVLAPFADLSFYDGHIDGNLIVEDWLWEPAPGPAAYDATRAGIGGRRTGQVNDYAFRGQVPVPATLLLVLAALPLLARRGVGSMRAAARA